MTILQNLEGPGVTIENTRFFVSGELRAGCWQVGGGLLQVDADPDEELTADAVRAAMELIRPVEEMQEPLRIGVAPDLSERLRGIVEGLEAKARRDDQVAVTDKALRANLTASSGWKDIEQMDGVVETSIVDREDGLDGIAVLVLVADNFEGTLPYFLPALGAAIPIYRRPNVTPLEGNRALDAQRSLEEQTCEAIQHALGLAQLIQRNVHYEQTPHGEPEKLGSPSRENSLAVTKLEEALMWADTDESLKLGSTPAWVRGSRPSEDSTPTTD